MCDCLVGTIWILYIHVLWILMVPCDIISAVGRKCIYYITSRWKICDLQLHSVCNRSNKRGAGRWQHYWKSMQQQNWEREREIYSVYNDVAQERVAKESGTLLTCTCGGREGWSTLVVTIWGWWCYRSIHFVWVHTRTQASKGVERWRREELTMCGNIYTPEGIATVMMQLFLDSLDNLLSLLISVAFGWSVLTQLSLSLYGLLSPQLACRGSGV